jgi:hypothetical protein
LVLRRRMPRTETDGGDWCLRPHMKVGTASRRRCSVRITNAVQDLGIWEFSKSW